MKLILNESELLDKSLNEGYVDKTKPTNTITVLAKHYLSVGMNSEQVLDSINDFLIQYFEGYTYVNWSNIIKKIINKLKRDGQFELCNVQSISIFQSEIDKINELSSFGMKKLSFVLLVYAKIYNLLHNTDTNWVNEQHKYIFSDAKLALTKYDQGKFLYRLKELGYIDVPIMVDSTNIKVNYVDHHDSDVKFNITDFRNFVYEYFNYLDPNKYIRCANCGILVKSKNNRMKYCTKCAKDINIQKTIENRKNKYLFEKGNRSNIDV